MKQTKTGAGGEIYSNPEADKLSSNYGLDIEEELTKMLTDELTKSIDRDILMSLGLEPDRNKRRKIFLILLIEFLSILYNCWNCL